MEVIETKMGIPEYLRDIDLRMKEVFKYSPEQIKTLENNFRVAVKSSHLNCFARNLSLGYIHKGWVYNTGDFSEIQENDGISPEWQLIRRLDPYPEDGLIKQFIKSLPRRSGLAKRKPEDFQLEIKTIIPNGDKDSNRSYLSCRPIVSLVTVRTAQNYPHNKRGTSMRALRDLSHLGSKILQAGINQNQIAFPYWVNADFCYGNIDTDTSGINNQEFLRALLNSRD